MPQLTRRLDANHDLVFGTGSLNYATENEAVAINVQTRLLTLLGEWFLNTDFGVGYLSGPQPVVVKPAQLPYVEAVLKNCVLGTEDVQSLLSFKLNLDHASRVLSVSGSYVTIYSDQAVTFSVTP